MDSADVVVVGGGTVGGWASWFAKRDGAERVIVLEAGTVGNGASSRSAGIVRAQGGTPTSVALGRWSIDFYKAQGDLIGTDSGFRELGYIILALSEEDERAGRKRVAMQQELGLPARWVSIDEAVRINPILSKAGHRGGTYLPGDGCIDPARNVRAYSLAMQAAGVELRERTQFMGIRSQAALVGGRKVVGVETSAGPIATERVILTGGPSLRAVGKAAGVSIPTGAARHTVCVLEQHEAFEADPLPIVFDISGEGVYWRPEEGGLLFGWSDPNERPGIARQIDWTMYERMRERLDELVPVARGLGIRRAWAATIDYTPDHLPILGPALQADGTAIAGLTVASPGGHGMMWGPSVARIAADLALRGRTDLLDVTDLGIGRFDEHGRSRLDPDPIALPFPAELDEGTAVS